jgi:DNA-binding NarL/FixJ family response regulator
VVDDHPLFRFGLCSVLNRAEDTEVVGEEATGTEAVATAAVTKPDVVVMDLHLPDINGVEATRRIISADSGVRVLVLTMFDDNDSVFAAMRAGARGYLLKGAGPEEIVRAVHAVGRGEAIFGQDIAAKRMSFFAAAPRRPAAFPELTGRELEILELIARGESNPSIARILVLSPKTVRNHVSNIFGKLQVADRAQAIVRAREAGLGDHP